MSAYDQAFIRRGPVSLQRASANRKLTHVEEVVYNPLSRFKRPVARAPYCTTTYVSIEATCPTTCRFKHAGCYVQSGITGARAKRLDVEAKGLLGLAVIRLEAALLDEQWPNGIPQDGQAGGRDLRLHVGGDVSCTEGARVLAGAAERWRERGGGAVWTYTHRWAEVPIEAWGTISIFASVESLEEADEASALGYVPGYTMAHFPSERAFSPKGSLEGLRIIPCPAQTRGQNCVKCRLCLGNLGTLPGTAIGFAMHGVRAKKARRRLPVMWEQVDERMDRAAEGLDGVRADLPETEAMVHEALDAAGIDMEDVA